ncbi:hypothetical protein [Planomonospora sp. ID82291]|uniref:hypothetical protein n=1 Tax=Planomonospora sp. ID82291 TaxID=2738136 RepID=UPI0018C391ED|nr:hypothetical protein [Planomonospora sp. ID82291]MBG0814818.1 hypothetical protein [Planomonospora sp. ID82291]
MRQRRCGAPFGWLLALLLPLFVSGGLNAPAALSYGAQHRPAVAKAPGDHHPFSRQVPLGERHLASAPAFTGTGAGGGHPAAAPPRSLPGPPSSPGRAVRPARGDDPRPLAALLVRSGRAPPSTGG